MTYASASAYASAINRRRFMQLGAGATALGALGPTRVFAQTPIETMIPNVLVSPGLREIVEREANVKITDAPYQSGPDSIARLLAPGGLSRFNVQFSLTDFARIPILGPSAGEEKVAELDLSKIPNAAKIADVFDPEIIQRDGKIYALPIFMGYNTVLYNPEVVAPDDELTQSWGAIFEDKYSGRIGWFESAHQMLVAAALYLGKADPETMSDQEVTEVGEFLISRKRHVRTIWTSFAQGANLLSTGEIVATFGPIPVRTQLEHEGVPIAASFVKEGVQSIVGGLFIPRDASEQDAAHAVIDAILSDEYGRALPQIGGYISANGASGDSMTPEERAKAGYGIYTGEVKHKSMPIPPNINVWVETWAKVKSA